MSTAALVTDPFPFVPVVVLAEVVMTAARARSIWRHIDGARVRALFLGCLVGVWAFQSVRVDLGRTVLSVFVLAMCAVL